MRTSGSRAVVPKPGCLSHSPRKLDQRGPDLPSRRCFNWPGVGSAHGLSFVSFSRVLLCGGPLPARSPCPWRWVPSRRPVAASSGAGRCRSGAPEEGTQTLPAPAGAAGGSQPPCRGQQWWLSCVPVSTRAGSLAQAIWPEPARRPDRWRPAGVRGQGLGPQQAAAEPAGPGASAA